MKSFLITILCLSTVVLGQSQPAASSQPLIIFDVNLVDTRQGQIVTHATVVVQDGRIQTIARFVPMRTRRPGLIIASGKYLIPGLWDMHVHSAFSSPTWDEKVIYPLYIANGITGIRDMGGDPDLLEQRRNRIERGELLGPHMIMAGPFLAGGKSDAQTIATNTPAEAKQAVETLKKRNVDFIKILDVPRDSFFAIAEAAKQQHVTFVGHVPRSVSALEASAAGQKSIEHLSGILLACSSKEQELRRRQLDALSARDYAGFAALGKEVIATYDGAKAKDLFRHLSKNGTWQVPTLVWTQTNASLDDPALAGDPRLKYVPASIRKEWDPAKLLKGTSTEILQLQKVEAARDVELVRAMHDAGLQFLAGSDGPDPYVFPGFSLHDELEWLVKSGLTPAEALQTATLKPAEFMGKADRYGAIEAGRVADLVLLDGNPLEDIRNTRKIAGVVLSGTYYSGADVDKILAQVGELASSR